jgi:hypothetical protein
VPIWITAEHPAINWSTSDEFAAEEAAFFGNLFSAEPAGYVCFGHDVATSPIPGRVCVNHSSCPYYDPYLARGGSCRLNDACRAHVSLDGVEGYESCAVGETTWSRVITTWKPAN